MFGMIITLRQGTIFKYTFIKTVLVKVAFSFNTELTGIDVI